MTIYKAFSEIFIPRFKDTGAISSFSALEVGSVRGSLFKGTRRMFFLGRSSVIRFISCYFTTLFRILPFFFFIWMAFVAIIYTVSFRSVDKEGLLEIILVREVVPKLKPVLLTVNLASTSYLIVNSMFIIEIFF